MTQRVIDLLLGAVKKYGDKPYTWDKTDSGYKSKTFKDIYTHAQYFSLSLNKWGYSYGDTIAILSESRSEWIVAEYGIIMRRCISVPLSTKLTSEEIIFRLVHSESKALLISNQSLLAIIDQLKTFINHSITLILLDAGSTVLIENYCKEHRCRPSLHYYTYSDALDIGREEYKRNGTSVSEAIDSISSDDIVTISYTSGTTGNPKGIMLTHENYYNNSIDAVSHFCLQQYLRLFIILPIDHSFAHTVGLYTACIQGLSLYFVDARQGSKSALKNIAQNIQESSPDFMLVVPALARHFFNKITESIHAKGKIIQAVFYYGLKVAERMYVQKTKVKRYTYFWDICAYTLIDMIIFRKIRNYFGKNFRYFICGGALLDIKLQKFFSYLKIPMYQGYGLTETAPIISTNAPHSNRFGSSGKPLPSIQCKIISSGGKECNTFERGEIIIKGKNVMKGYFKNIKATKETFKKGWLYTGDLGYMDADGFLYITGREKALLISTDGEKYSPEEIEEAIVSCSEFIVQCFIYNDHKKFTSALIVLDTQKLREYVAGYALTEPYHILEHIKKSFYAFKTSSEYAHKFPEKWIPSTFRIAPSSFNEQNHQLNSTLKMVRYKIVDDYKNVFNTMYASEGTDIFVDHNYSLVQSMLS